MSQNEQQGVRYNYQYLRDALEEAGKVVWRDSSGTSQAVLVSTPNLLIALRQEFGVRRGTKIQVFSLASPEAQLLGTVSADKIGDPAAYFLQPDYLK
jgi:hypothetical protein